MSDQQVKILDVSDYKECLFKAQQENADLRRELSAQVQTNADLRRQVDELSRKALQLEQERDAAQARVAELESELKKSIGSFKRCNRAKEAINRYSHELERQCEEDIYKQKRSENEVDVWKRKYFNAEGIIRLRHEG